MSTASGNQPAAPFRALPTDTYHTADLKLSEFFNGEGVQIIHQPAAHTDGDSLVYFRYSDVIAAGDIFVTTSYPIIDLARGGSINGTIDALNHMLDIAVPEFRLEGGTYIIPGHGRLCDAADVAYYRDMTTIIRDRIQDSIKKGMTLEQVKAAHPPATMTAGTARPQASGPRMRLSKRCSRVSVRKMRMNHRIARRIAPILTLAAVLFALPAGVRAQQGRGAAPTPKAAAIDITGYCGAGDQTGATG
jgi:glyoxylase-like metal-dependent hydrolase (beta-lactamase superfamily II)